jgi:hypothetical protein
MLGFLFWVVSFVYVWLAPVVIPRYPLLRFLFGTWTFLVLLDDDSYSYHRPCISYPTRTIVNGVLNNPVLDVRRSTNWFKYGTRGPWLR